MTDPDSERDVEAPPSETDAAAGPPFAGQDAAAGPTGEDDDPSAPVERAEPSVAEKAGIDDDVVGAPRRLDPRVRYAWVVGSLFGTVVLAGLAGAAAFVLGGVVGAFDRSASTAAVVGVVVLGVVLSLGVLRALLLYRSWEYVVREDSLFLSRGVLTRVRTVAPYVRVQHIDTRRSPLERVLGLSTLVVYTAGSRGADVTIPGLTPDRATDLQDRLKRLAIESEDEDAV